MTEFFINKNILVTLHLLLLTLFSTASAMFSNYMKFEYLFCYLYLYRTADYYIPSISVSSLVSLTLDPKNPQEVSKTPYKVIIMNFPRSNKFSRSSDSKRRGKIPHGTMRLTLLWLGGICVHHTQNVVILPHPGELIIQYLYNTKYNHLTWVSKSKV